MQWDTAGQERFKALTNNYYRDANGIVVIYDVTDKRSFEAIDQWMEDISKYDFLKEIFEGPCSYFIGRQ